MAGNLWLLKTGSPAVRQPRHAGSLDGDVRLDHGADVTVLENQYSPTSSPNGNIEHRSGIPAPNRLFKKSSSQEFTEPEPLGAAPSCVESKPRRIWSTSPRAIRSRNSRCSPRSNRSWVRCCDSAKSTDCRDSQTPSSHGPFRCPMRSLCPSSKQRKARGPR